MNYAPHPLAWIAAGALLAAPLACSFSNSSESSSDSSTSVSKSSTSSSGEEKDSARFREDVEHYTEAYCEAGGRGEDGFLTGLGELARKRGVSDWEADPSTWESIGRGLGGTPLSEAQRSAYARAWTADDAEKGHALVRGLEASR